MMKMHRLFVTIGTALLAAICVAPAAFAQLAAANSQTDPGTALVEGGGCSSWRQSGWLNQLSFSASGARDQRAFHTRFRLGTEHLDIGYRNGQLGLRYRSAGDSRSINLPLNTMAGPGQSALVEFLRALSPRFKASVNTELLDLALSSSGASAETIPFEIAVINTGSAATSSQAALTAQRSILDCGSYAVCYWGCVAGGGGWLGCGYSCNGGGAGEGRCY